MDHIELCYNDESSSNDRVMLSFQVRPIIHIYKLITVRACRVVLCYMPRGALLHAVRPIIHIYQLTTVPWACPISDAVPQSVGWHSRSKATKARRRIALHSALVYNSANRCTAGGRQRS